MAYSRPLARHESCRGPHRHSPPNPPEHQTDDDLHRPNRPKPRPRQRAIHLPDHDALRDPSGLYAYFVRLTDANGRRLVGIRRATLFKGVVKSRLIRVLTDAVELVDDTVFKLDHDFDLIADSGRVHMLRPTSFEFLAQLQAAVLAAVPDNVGVVEKALPFVDFEPITAYAMEHPRAARYLASIRSQGGLDGIDPRRLASLCRDTGVEVARVKGRLTVDAGNVLAFLEVLDRRRYELELISGSPERFRAASRTRLTDAQADTLMARDIR